jgi:modulator of FtsH protease
MHGYNPAAWTGFFTAVTGAAAALTGLLFVAVSINLKNILGDTAKDTANGAANGATKGTTMLPARAAETLATLLFVVIISALALVPQDVELLGAEILVISVPLTVITVRNQLKFRRQNPDSPLLWSASRMTASALALVPGTLAGISLAAHWGGGLYWLAPTAVCGIAGAVYSAWVLLVEIVR